MLLGTFLALMYPRSLKWNTEVMISLPFLLDCRKEKNAILQAKMHRKHFRYYYMIRVLLILISQVVFVVKAAAAAFYLLV